MMRRNFCRLTSTLAFPLLLAGLVFFGNPVKTKAAELAPEVADRLRDQIKTLAGDEFEGRGVGTAGLNSAADYVSKAFQSAGLNVSAVDGKAFQEFEIATGNKLLEGNSLAFTLPDGSNITALMDKDFRINVVGGSGEFKGELVFVGYGIESKDMAYDDFAGIDVAGKIVIVMRRNPKQGVKDGPFGDGLRASRFAELRTKLLNCAAHKAAAVLFVNDPYQVAQTQAQRLTEVAKLEQSIKTTETELAKPDQNAETTKQLEAKLNSLKKLIETQRKASQTPDELMPFGYGGTGDAKSAPAIHITQELCDRLLKAGAGKSLKELETAIDADFKPVSLALKGCSVQGKSNFERTSAPVKNVIGVLEGEGPLANETLIIGAHYDHVGRGGRASLAPGSSDIHNGADDNASGTVALLEVARRIAAQGKLPRRVVFIAFTGEEMGLLGSAHYVRKPVFPLENTIAMLNMDMVGRMQENSLTIYGLGTSKVWDARVKQDSEPLGFKLTLKPEGFGPSDHSSFYAKKIPVLHFFTGMHPDYHRPSDDWDKINIEGMARVVDLVSTIALQTAKDSAKPDYVEVKGNANINRNGDRPYVGTIPDFGSNDPGYSISGAAADSPAAIAGLKGGDRIIKLGKYPVTGLDDFDAALRKFKAGDEVVFLIVRDGKEASVKVILGAPRG